ncbi:MAG: extracellular solute-binding protein [Oscillospiraceae bacterium]|jgi:hypothetical protein|nr:extracellular solute-binding protein [Oscillospiraceae bacterium]
MKKFTRCIAALITLASLALTGCNGAPKPGDAGAVPGEKIAFENVFTETPLLVELDRVYYNGVKSAGDRVYVSGYKAEPAAEGGEYQTLISCKLDGSDVKTHWEQPPQTADDGETPPISDFAQISSFDADADGNLWLVINASHSDNTDPANPIYENKFSIVKLAPDGTEVFNTDLSSPEGGELGVMYVQDVLHDSAGNVYLQGQNIYAFSADGKYAFTLRDAAYIYGITATNEGEVIYLIQEVTGADVSWVFKTIDFAARSAGAAVKHSGGVISFYNVYPGNGEYIFYYQYQSGIYGMRSDAASGMLTGEKVIDFINSDISYNGNQRFASTDGGGFVMAAQDRAGTKQAAVYALTEDKNASLEGKTVLTLGALYGDLNAVMRFNKANRAARIVVKDYTEYNTPDDYTKGQTQLDLDILSGRAPDIVASAGQITKYTPKGALADLTPFLESGKHGVLRENLFENILALGAKDGKVYQILPRFYIITLAGKESIFGARTSITAAELAETAAEYPDALIIQNMTASDWLNYSIWMGMGNYVDYDSGTCSFNSPEFISTLEFSKRFPRELGSGAMFTDEASYLEYEREMEGAYAEDRVLLRSGAAYMNESRVAREMDVVFGEKTALIGFPTEGTSGGIVIGNIGYAVAESSPNKDLAWEFICGVITYDESEGGEMSGAGTNGISLDKRRFEEEARAEMIPLEDRDFTNPFLITRLNSGGGSSSIFINSPDEIDMTDPYFADYALTEDDVERAFRAISGASTKFSSDEQISKIVTEEAAAFFSGAKTAEETANIIQSRASLYVSETS